MKINWLPLLFTSKGLVRENVLNGARALDVGCGDRKLPGAIGVDSLSLPAVDVVHDLNTYPWPFENESFELIFASHYLEHAEDILKTMEEIHRLLVPGGRAVIQVPYFRSVDAATDPTHKHFLTSASLDYMIKDTKLAEYKHTPFLFTQIAFWYGWPRPSRNPIKQMFRSYVHTHKEWYDQYASLMFPTECITWELEKA